MSLRSTYEIAAAPPTNVVLDLPNLLIHLPHPAPAIPMTLVARVYIVRHGETDDNRRGIIQGHLDTPLNAAGVRQACLAADALADVPFDAAYTSDLSRARKVRNIIPCVGRNGSVSNA